MRTFYGLILLLFLGVVLIFSLQNSQAVTVRFLGYSATGPIPLLVIGVYLLGMMTGATVVGFINRLLRRVGDHTPATTTR